MALMAEQEVAMAGNGGLWPAAGGGPGLNVGERDYKMSTLANK